MTSNQANLTDSHRYTDKEAGLHSPEQSTTLARQTRKSLSPDRDKAKNSKKN